MRRIIPAAYRSYLQSRQQRAITADEERRGLSARGFWIGAFLSFFYAIGAPYGNMVMRASQMAFDFNTPGAIFLFLVLIGLLNLAFKLSYRFTPVAWGLLVAIGGGWIWSYAPFEGVDIYTPGFWFSSFSLITAGCNALWVARGRRFALNRSELILVYIMLIIVAALCTMGMTQQLLPLMTGLFYYASPQNKWAEKLIPVLPERPLLVDDGAQNTAFFEGLGPRTAVPYEVWIEPLAWWGVFLLALYTVMVCIGVILRKQWVERERLAYPLTQVGLAMVGQEDEKSLVNGFFKNRLVWYGMAVPLLVGSLRALHAYDPSVPTLTVIWRMPFLSYQNLQFWISFTMVGFSYLINTQVAAGLWIFHLLGKFEREFLMVAGITSEQKIVYGVDNMPFLAYQGVGALLAMVVVGLWMGREHLGQVFRKAIGRAPEVDDSAEIMPYRWAVIGLVGGTGIMVGWLLIMGTTLWVALFFMAVALLIFIGLTRIVAESGLAAVRAPMTAPELTALGFGVSTIGTGSLVNMSLSYVWAADIRVFVMAVFANGLRLVEEMDLKSRRYVLWGVVLAVLIGAGGSAWMLLHLTYKYGGVNMGSWVYQGGPAAAYNHTVRNLESAGIYWEGWGFFAGGAAVMLALMWARNHLTWWPLHPLGFPISANFMMHKIWFSIFLAWLVKRIVLRYGGASVYKKSQAFFLGLIAGEVLCNGIWLVIDYFTGKVGNVVFTLG